MCFVTNLGAIKLKNLPAYTFFIRYDGRKFISLRVFAVKNSFQFKLETLVSINGGFNFHTYPPYASKLNATD